MAESEFVISGATGFIGRRLVRALRKDGESCRLLARRPIPNENALLVDFSDKSTLTAALSGSERVFHCAGYAHAFSSRNADDAQQHWRVNFEATRNLVEAAGLAGVKRFVFLSSVKAMAEPGELCADEDFPGKPESDYGAAKRAAEQAVLAVGRSSGMHVVNLRLAMVYGAGGKGNLERMGRLVKRGFFPPLPETGNHRSLIHVDDVVSALRLVAEDERAAGKTYVLASPHAPSGRALFNALREAHGLPACRWSVPKFVLQTAAILGDLLELPLGRRLPLNSEVVERLLGSAWYSPMRIERELGWRAQVSLADGLCEMLKNETNT